MSASDRSTTAAWAATVEHALTALTTAASAGDWIAADELAAQLGAALAVPNLADDSARHALYARARDVIGDVAEAANEAREATRAAVQTIARGRKAVAAYI